jgi:hypothetical protein
MNWIFRSVCAIFLFGAMDISAFAEPLRVEAEPVALKGDDDRITRVGGLGYLGGLKLSSPDNRFGGLSGLAVSPDGRTLHAVTDRGDWIRLEPILEPNGRLVGIKRATIGRLIRPNGRPAGNKINADAESLFRYKGGFAVAFEHNHRIWHYRGGKNPFQQRPIIIATPKLLRRAHRNKALEAVVSLPDGRIVAIAEDYPTEQKWFAGWVLDSGKWQPFRYLRTGRFHPVGAARLGHGNILILERRFSFLGGNASRLVSLDPSALHPGAVVRGREIARLQRPLITENFEGLDAYRGPGGQTRIYMISDDNFHFLQTTLLLHFEIAN